MLAAWFNTFKTVGKELQEVFVPSVFKYLLALLVCVGARALNADVAVVCPVPPLDIAKVPASVTAPVVVVFGVNPVVPAVNEVTPPVDADQTAVVPLEVRTYPLDPIGSLVALFTPFPTIRSPVDVMGDVGPEKATWPGTDHVMDEEAAELTIAIESQTKVVGLVGGIAVQPDGGVPVSVVKSHDPPVGVAGCVDDTLKINHSKIELEPLDVGVPYSPAVCATPP